MAKAENVTIFNKNKKRYGYRRITQELHNNENHKTIQKLMKQPGLLCHIREKRKYNFYKGKVGEVVGYNLSRHPIKNKGEMPIRKVSEFCRMAIKNHYPM